MGTAVEAAAQAVDTDCPGWVKATSSPETCIHMTMNLAYIIHLHPTWPRHRVPFPDLAIYLDCERYIVLWYRPLLQLLIRPGTAWVTGKRISNQRRTTVTLISTVRAASPVMSRVMRRFAGAAWSPCLHRLIRQHPTVLSAYLHPPPIWSVKCPDKGMPRRRTSNDVRGARPSVSSNTDRCVNRGRMISQTRSCVNSSSMNSSKYVKENPPTAYQRPTAWKYGDDTHRHAVYAIYGNLS